MRLAWDSAPLSGKCLAVYLRLRTGCAAETSGARLLFLRKSRFRALTFLFFQGLTCGTTLCPRKRHLGFTWRRVRKGRQFLSSCTLKSLPGALFLNPKSRTTLLARKQVISIEVSHVALRPFKQTHFPLGLKPQSFTIGKGYWSASIICGEILRCGTCWIWLLSSAVLEIPGWCHWQTCAKNHCKGIRLGWLLKSLAKSQHVADIFGEVII